MHKRFVFILVAVLGLIVAIISAARHSSSALTTQVQQKKPQAPMPSATIAATMQCSIVDELDDCIQERFNHLDNGFGAARMMTFRNNNHFANFRPENEREMKAVTYLESQHWEVLFYLAGRKVLDPQPQVNPPGIVEVLGISLPALVTTFKAPGEKATLSPAFTSILGPPVYGQRMHVLTSETEKLRVQAREAFKAFQKDDQYNFVINGLTYTARPVRAQESCLQCHNPNDAEKELIKLGNTTDSETSKLRLELLLRRNAANKTPLKVGDALGAVIYAFHKNNQ